MKHEAKWGVEGEKGSAKIVANCSACGASLTYTGASLSSMEAVQEARNLELQHGDGTKEKIPLDVWEKFREQKIDTSAY
jgi:hypothetical protein